MTPYTTSYSIRYTLASIQQQVESAVMIAAGDIKNEDAAAPDHADRLKWAQWATKNSSVAGMTYFGWSVAMNASIQASVAEDPTGGSVNDSDIQFVVNSALPAVIADFTANPPGVLP